MNTCCSELALRSMFVDKWIGVKLETLMEY